MARLPTINTDETIKKPRKKRKPMTPEQKKAAGERLALAREKRLAENPPQYKSIHPSVVERGDDDPLSMKKVQMWIKTQKDLLSAAKRGVRDKVKGAEAKVSQHEGYIRNLHRYLRDGDYVDTRYGEHQQSAIKYRCVAMAYYADGTPKRTEGIFYPDLGYTWMGDHHVEEER